MSESLRWRAFVKAPATTARLVAMLWLAALVACRGASQAGGDGDVADTIPPRADSLGVSQAGDSQSLEGRTWRLVEYVADLGSESPEQRPPAERLPRVPLTPVARAAMQFERGTVSGTTGCNRLASAYTLTDSSIAFELGRSTMMACNDAIMSQEQTILAHWPNVVRYAVVNERLQLMNQRGAVLMTFEQERPRALVGTLWEATGYNNGRGGVTTLVANTRITAEFTESGRVSGSSGCNTYRAGFATQADTLNFTPPESTEMMCSTPAGVMEQESAYLAALQTVSTFRIENDVLEWRTRSGAIAARFKAAQ